MYTRDYNVKGTSQMTSDNQAPIDDTAGHLAKVRSDVAAFIFDLAFGGFDVGIDAAFNRKLWQVCAAHQREVDRQLKGDPGSPEVFERLEVFVLLGMLLTQRLIDFLVDNTSKGARRTAQQRKAVRMLNEVLKQFSDSQDELELRFPRPDLSNLAEKFWFNFYDVTVEECQRDAADITAHIAAIKQTAT